MQTSYRTSVKRTTHNTIEYVLFCSVLFCFLSFAITDLLNYPYPYPYPSLSLSLPIPPYLYPYLYPYLSLFLSLSLSLSLSLILPIPTLLYLSRPDVYGCAVEGMCCEGAGEAGVSTGRTEDQSQYHKYRRGGLRGRVQSDAWRHHEVRLRTFF